MGRRLAFGLVVVVCAGSAMGCRLGFDDTAGDDGDDGDDVPDGIARVTIAMTGTGAGMVVGNLGVSCTTAPCVVDVPEGTALTLRGLAAGESWLAGWSGPCGGNFDCAFAATEDVTVTADFSPRPNRVFVSSTVVNGAIGGLAGADLFCQQRADAAGLGGAWIAYLSDGVTQALDRISGLRGFIRVDGAPIADSPAQFAGGPLIFAPRLDEYGDDVGTSGVFTGTRGGSTTINHCLAWTSNLDVDAGSAVDTNWGSTFATESWNAGCDDVARLLCIETGQNVEVRIAPDTGRLAFVTSALWTPGGGRAAADAVCAAEATGASLPGSFLAAIATTTETIENRFAPGLPWVRVDGVRITRGNTMFIADYLDVSPERDRAGQVIANDFWSGAVQFDTLGVAEGNCNDWTIGDLTGTGDMHFTTSTWVGSPAKREPCDWAVPLLCLQE